jgi:hypothetical protein
VSANEDGHMRWPQRFVAAKCWLDTEIIVSVFRSTGVTAKCWLDPEITVRVFRSTGVVVTA